MEEGVVVRWSMKNLLRETKVPQDKKCKRVIIENISLW